MNDSLLAEALKLSVDERIELAEAIWDSVRPSQADLPLTGDQKVLLEERYAAFKTNPDVGSSWEEVRARLERLT